MQTIVLPIADRHAEYAATVAARLRDTGARAELDDRSESLGRRIRDAEVRKIPYILVAGDREVDAGQVSLREHRKGDEGAVAVEEFAARLARESAERSA